MSAIHPADDTTGIVEAVHREAARLRAEDEKRRLAVIDDVLLDFLGTNERHYVARVILAALDDLA